MLKTNFANGQFSFEDLGVVNAGARCTTGYGYDLNDLGVRWNDIDGDGNVASYATKRLLLISQAELTSCVWS